MLKQLILVVTLSVVSQTSFAWQEGSLTIWLKEDLGNDGFRKLAEQFTRDTGAAVTVLTLPGGIERFHQQVVLSSGPDLFIFPHDRVGEWARAGLIAPVSPKASTLANIDANFWNAVSYDGQFYGFPIAVEGPTQICNANLIEAPFETLSDVREAFPGLNARGIAPLLWDYNNAYFSYGFITSEGGFAFAYNNGNYSPSITGVNNRGAITGAQAIQDLVSDGILPKQMDYGVFDNAFISGKAACVINGPWAWSSYQQAGLNLVLGPYPSVSPFGNPQGFTGVLSAVINSSTPNQTLAATFMEDYLLTESGLKTVNDDKPLGAVTHSAYMATLAQNNPVLKQAFDVWRTGEPMPNIPKMAQFWTHLEPALQAIAQGANAEQSLDAAASRITR